LATLKDPQMSVATAMAIQAAWHEDYEDAK
jgi:hypothetical protein